MPARGIFATDRGDMKLILIPDNPACSFSHATRPKIAISIPGDDHTIHDIIEKLVTPALVAMSFHPQTIQDGYHEAQVMGAREAEKAPATIDDLTEWSAPVTDPTPPEGFTIVGYNVVGPDPDECLPSGDLIYCYGGAWCATLFADGQECWYAARNGSETLAKLQAHVAATR